ncbi:RagB/SusD family nutrient uptake outer membrane protein [Segatella copri]|nr:RagB/SusD family nutrient uptake outer membrane protein [Segatella copri]
MIMKTNNISIKVLTGMLIMASVTTGCKDSFLNPDPLSLYEPTATFSSQAGLDAALASADKGLKAYWTNTNAIDLQLPLTSEAMFSDITVASKTDDAFAFTDIKERFTPTQGYFNDDRNRLTIFWGETYNGIKYANTVIHYLPKVTTLDAATRDAYMGRAYFHRAYRYLNLCFEFGNVPLVTKVLESPKLNYKSTKKEAIIKMITKDMEFAVQHVPEQSQMTYLGMINKGACRQLLIKCYLANGDFEKAKLQADTLINYSGYQLMTDNFGTFVNPNPKTWNITENVIWDLHRPENKSISANKEAILIMANRYGTDSGIRLRLMRNVVPWWNSNALKTPDNKLAVDRYSLTNSLYEESLDYNRAFGRGVGVVRPTYWAEKGMWNLNGKPDETDLRHNSKVGNWVNMNYNNKNEYG